MAHPEVAAARRQARPACGGEAQWSPRRQALVCAYCGTASPYQVAADGQLVEHDLVAALRAIPAGQRDWQDDGRRSVRCQHCQAISVFSAAQQGRACDFCGSTALVPFQEEGAGVIRPQGLLPFGIDAPGARDRLRQWYRSRFWAPGDLGRQALTDTLRGVYLPYWTFDSDVSADYLAEGGRYYKDSQGRRQVRWFPVAGHVRHAFDDTLVCASRGVHPRLIEAVEPFPTTGAGLRPYDPAYLSGWTVERYQLDLVAAAGRARQRMLAAIRRLCAQDIRADTHRNLQVTARFERQTFKHVLLPVWLVSYRYGSRDYQALVNGATGQVAGEYPKSWVKIGIAVLLALVALVLVAWLEWG
jgi:hypothetical protein